MRQAPASGAVADVGAIAGAVERHPLWYHTLELAPDVVTPGWFDLRPVVEGLPWPEVSGRRCLDVGTYDGFFAFELERRGAAEVVATDLGSHWDWDWLPHERAKGPQHLATIAGPDKGAGFRIASAALGSSVERIELSVYDLTPDRIGTFDVVICGALLLHLRDPIRALDAIRSVCRGQLLSMEEVKLDLALLHPRRAVAELKQKRGQWWVPNPAGHRRMILGGGFRIEEAPRPYGVPLGLGHPAQPFSPRLDQRLLRRLLMRGVGQPFSAVLAQPAAPGHASTSPP